MSEDEQKKAATEDETDEVELHSHKKAANEEPTDEVEAHMKRATHKKA